MVYEGENGAFIRKDYCHTCSGSCASQEGVVSSWKSVVPTRKKEQQPFDRNERALELLRACVARDEVEEREEAFVLALYLARNRKLLQRKDLSPEVALYEIAATEEMLPVHKVSLSSLGVAEVQERLARKFTSEGDN